MWAFFVLPSSSFHMSFLHNIFLYCSLWNFPYSSNSHRFDLPGLQELILSQRIRSTPNSEKIIRQPSLFQHYALIGAQRVGGVGVVTQQFLGIGPAYGQGLGNFPLPQVAENQQLRLAVVPAIG